MVDIHSHILFGLDDGAELFEDSLAMAEDAIADGITHVVATPHANAEYSFDFAKVRSKCELLSQKLAGRLTVLTGCDFHLTPENLLALREKPEPYCINQKDYLLVEFNDFSIPPTMDRTLHELQLRGIRPIITHPERNGILRAQPERLGKWIRLGCFAQITAGSLIGMFGPGPQQDAWTWIEQGLVHFIASDAHNTLRRPLKLKFAFDAAEKRLGQTVAQALLEQNPKAALEGHALPYVPDVSEPARPKRKRFLFF